MSAQQIGAVPRVAVVTSPAVRVRHLAVWGGPYPSIGPLCRNRGFDPDTWQYFPAQSDDYPADITWCTRCRAEVGAMWAATVLA